MLTKLWDFFFHRHQWVTRKEGRLLDPDTKGCFGIYYIQECQHCGKIRQRKFE